MERGIWHTLLLPFYLIIILVNFEYVASRSVSTTTATVINDDSSWRTIRHWPDGVIPFNLTETMYDRSERGLILSAMRKWEYKTCLKFVPWTEDLRRELGEDRYISFFSAGSCFSRTGMQDDQPQLFGLGQGCLKMETILHELGHTIGLVHEMERPDREFYIQVNRENMNEDSRRNFDTTDSKGTLYNLYDTPYDYKSIMHYGPKAWSKNRRVVLVSKDPAYQHVIGKADDISFYNALYVNRAYGCSEQCSDTLQGLCLNGGFLGGQDCKCFCQDGYAGQFCETALPGFEHIIEWKCQKDWVFHDGKCYMFSDEKDNKDFHRSRLSCRRNNASLVTFKDRPELEWLNHKVHEQQLTTESVSFWIGMTKEPDTGAIKWIDGTLVDSNLVSLVDDVVDDQPGCAVFDGETVVLNNCTSRENIGYICEKDFDVSCGGRYTVSDSSPTFIHSPGFPRSYPGDIKCTYILQTSADSQIRIEFQTFELDRNGKDFMDVLLQNDVTHPEERFIGESLNGRYLDTEGNLAVLTFKTNGRISEKGFQASVTKLSPAVASTELSLPFLDAIRKSFCSERETTEASDESQSWWSLSELFNIFKSMTFSKLL